MTEPVTMLTKQQCQPRAMTAKAMDGHGIEYRAIDITESEAALAWALENDFRGDPIVVVGETATEGPTLGRASGLTESPASPLG